MCGINLIIDKKSSLDDAVIQRMNAAINHRGPDYNHWLKTRTKNESVLLGNTRLEIIDPHERSHQPMSSSDGQCLLTFNGEIYNHGALRDELSSLGYSFNTESDTEVLLNWLIHFGVGGIGKLNGMFAFAFVDIRKQRLLLARDRHGMKPLYYAESESAIIASSEIKGILSSNLVSKELDGDQISQYLQFKYVKSPNTFYKGIRALEPGHFIEYNTEGVNQASFLKADKRTLRQPSSDTLATIESLLTESIERHHIADTKVGLFLSGGVDSTLLLGLSKKIGKSEMPTYSIAHSKSEGSFATEDARFAKKASQLFGSDHHEFEVSRTVLQKLPEHIAQMDQPIGDSASLLTDLLSREAGSQVKCVMSGAGADEWFAGYNRHQAYYHYLNNGLLKGNPKILKGMARLLPTGLDHPLRKPFQLAKKFLINLDPDPQVTYMNFLRFAYFNNSKSQSGSNNNDLFEWALEHDRSNYLVDDVLMLNDQWSMQNSLEIRMPFLDNPLTQFIQTLPQEYLIKNGKKWILKEILNKYCGKEFSDRPKEGFGLPSGKWLQEGYFKDHLGFLNNPQSIIFNYVAKDHIEQLIQSHVKKKADYSLEFWSMMILSNWLETHFT